MIADHRRPLAADLGLERVEEDAVPILERGIRREDGNHLRTLVARIGVVDLADGERLADVGAARELLDDRQFGRIDNRLVAAAVDGGLLEVASEWRKVGVWKYEKIWVGTM